MVVKEMIILGPFKKPEMAGMFMLVIQDHLDLVPGAQIYWF
jgi:hypothetical protein